MWHEARKQEKKIRGLMVDYKRRAERRREFYEKIKLDPAQFVRVFGQSCKINLDPAIAVAAESPQSMMPWQGDTSNMIDRFDVRAHLDIMPPEKSHTVQLTREEEDEERKANYERYRIIVENECAGLTEEQALQQLYFDELYGAINKDGEEEKSKLKEKKAAIGYVYEDSTKKEEEENEDSDSEESEKEDIETLDLDIALDIDSLLPDQMELLNVCGTQFGMGKDDFIKYLRRDKDESEALKMAKLLEEEKAQFAGRKSRRERRIYKEKRLAGRPLSPPSYAARDSPKYEPYRRSSSKSRSRSKTPPRKVRKMYITSFGENDDSDEGMGVVHGPQLPPPALGTSKESEKKTEKTCERKKTSIRSRSRGSRSSERTSFQNRGTANRSRSREYRSRRSRDRRSRSRDRRSRSRDRRSRDRRSRSRDRSSRSRDQRSRSRDRRNRNGRSSRSRSRDVRRMSRDRYSTEQRRRSDDRYRGQRSRSKSRRSQSADKYSGSSKHNRPKSHSKSRSKSRSRSRRSSVSSSSSSRSRSSSKSSRSKSRSPVKPVLKSYRRESLSSNSDSDSESETKKPSTSHNSKPSSSKVGMPKPIGVFGKSASSSQRLTPQEKLKRRMQLALSKQYKADKKAEIQKQEKLEQEKLDREEELRQRALEMRRKEREKRHQDMDEGYSDEGSSRGSSPPRQRRETKSPPRKLGREDDKRKIRRSRSRSRSRSPERRKPNYR